MLLLTGHTNVVFTVGFSPSGGELFSAGRDRTVRVWDLAAGRERLVIRSSQFATQASLSSGGRVIAATGLDGILSLYDAATGEVTFRLHRPARIVGAVFAPDTGELITLGNTDRGGRLRWWNLATRKELPAWEEIGPAHPILGHSGDYSALAISPDGRLLVGLRAGGWTVWDRATRQRRRVNQDFRHGGTALAFAPDSRRLAVASGPQLWVWDVVADEELAHLDRGKPHFRGVTFTRDGRYLAAVGDGPAVTFWDAATWHEHGSLRLPAGRLWCVAFSPDGLRAAAGGDGRAVVVWDVDL
jgi:WD40 repeat protein